MTSWHLTLQRRDPDSASIGRYGPSGREIWAGEPPSWWAAWLLGSQTYREDKKGADRGIDGNIYFHNGPYGLGRIIVSVKGGEHVGVQMKWFATCGV